MAIAYIQGNSHANGATSSTTVAVTLGATVGVGNMLAVSLGTVSNTLSSVTDDKSNVYTVVFNGSTSTASGFTFATAYCLNITNAPQTITATWSGSTSFSTILVDEFSGVATSSALDGPPSVNPGQTGVVGASAVFSGNTTTTVNGDLIYGSGVSITGFGPFTAGAVPAFTQAQIITSAYLTEYLVQSTAGAIQATFSSGQISDMFTTQVMAFKAASAPTPFTALAFSDFDMGINFGADIVSYG